MKSLTTLITALCLASAPLSQAKDKVEEADIYVAVVSVKEGEPDGEQLKGSITAVLKKGKVTAVAVDGKKATITISSTERVSKSDITKALKDLPEYKVEECGKQKKPKESDGEKEADADKKE